MARSGLRCGQVSGNAKGARSHELTSAFESPVHLFVRLFILKMQPAWFSRSFAISSRDSSHRGAHQEKRLGMTFSLIDK
jgi:hypothetical protein